MSSVEESPPKSQIDEASTSKIATIGIIQSMIPTMPVKTDRAKFARCGISGLPTGISAYQQSIKCLDISENKFTSLGPDDFSRLQSLQILDASMNLIQKVENGLPPTIIQMDLSFNPIDISSVWDLYLPKLELLRLSNCGISSVPSTVPAWSSTIKSLYLDGNNLDAIPSVLYNFPILEDFSLFGNNITSIVLQKSPHSFKNINLGFNPTSNIVCPSELKVQTLWLNSCNFPSVPSSALEISGLRVLMMSRCGVSGALSISVPPLLAILDLSFNSISSLSDGFPASCGSISILNLSHNNLTSLPDTFPSQLCLSQLLLSHNSLTSLPQSLLSSKSLERLNVSHNCLTSIGDFKYPQLREIDVSFNSLTSIPDSFSSCSFLISANFSFNQLDNLPHSLTSCRRMLDLIAPGNKFLAPPRCILAFASLRTLVLSYNKLTSLPQSMSSFFFLRTLDLSNNAFVEIPNVIETLHSLRFLSLSHNRIERISPSLHFPASLVNLDLSFNMITEFTGIELSNLASLSLECNRMSKLQFQSLCSLHFLSLGGNCLDDQSSACLQAALQLQHIRVVDIVGNSINLKDKPSNVVLLTSDIVKFPIEFGVGYSSTLGPRPTMEDSMIIRADLGLFGVFDGHAGFNSSALASTLIAEEGAAILKQSNVKELFSKSFTKIHESLRVANVDDGCTAAVVLIREKKCYVVGIGDSRIVRVRKTDCQRVTVDHKPYDKEEFNRLKAAGLGVNFEGRIRRRLAVARSLGDFWCGEGIYVEPDALEYEISEDDIGLVIACDGLWDVFDDQSAADVVRKSATAEDAATTLKNVGIALGSNDNVSVIVIKFGESGFSPKNTVEPLPILEIKETEADEMSVPPLSPPTGRRRR